MLLKPISFMRKTAGGVFSPQDLFDAGGDGFWIEPSLTTSFESVDNSNPAEVADNVLYQEDLSSNARHFSSTGAPPQLALDGSTYALDFEESQGDRLETPSYAAVDSTNGVTLFARFKPESFTDNGNVIGSQAAQNRFQFRVTTGGLAQLIGFSDTGTVVDAAGTTTMSTGTWYNMCGIFNTTNARVWLDTMTDAGVEGTTTNADGTVEAASDNVWLGARRDVIGDNFDGLVAFALCISRSLSESERIDLATYASGL